MCHRLNRGQHLLNLESGVVDAVVDADAVIGCTNETERKALLRDVGRHVLDRLGVADLVLWDAVLTTHKPLCKHACLNVMYYLDQVKYLPGTSPREMQTERDNSLI